MARMDFGTFVFGAIVGAVGVSIATAERRLPPPVEDPRPRPLFAPPPVPVAEDGTPVKRKVMVPPWLWGRRLQREET